jgi:YcxB-like protein
VKLHYRNTIDDLVAFNRHVQARSPLFRPQARAMAMWVFVLVLMVFYLLPFDVREQPNWLVALAGAFALATAVCVALSVYFLWKPYLLRKVGQSVRKIYLKNPDKIALTHKELEVVGGELVERNEFGEFRWKLAAVEAIETTRDYAFIKMSALRAYILPREAFAAEELEAFLDDLERAYRRPPPLPAESGRASPADAIRRAQGW